MGKRTYVPVEGGCIDLTPCADCSAQAKAMTCAFEGGAAACANCCEAGYDFSDRVSVFEACACGTGGPCQSACSTSVLCGGAGPETAACTNCMNTALTDGGACVASAAFEAACINAGGSNSCRTFAQCLVGCPSQ